MKTIKDFYKNKRILVTGGAGFIGSYIAEELVKLEAKVTILDNFSTGTLNNLRSILAQLNIIYGDITNPFTCLGATNNQEIVFHLAALVSVPGSIKNPKLCHKINLEGTKNLLDGCIKKNVKTFIFSSSSAVYGNKENECYEVDELNPLSPYAQSKMDSEILCRTYSEKYNILSASLRYFNVYGDRQNPNGEYAAVVAKFKENLKNNKPLIIFGDGKQTRDFIPVSKVAQANLKIAMLDDIKGDIFNIATGKSINLFELIEQLEQEINLTKKDLQFMPARPGDIIHSAANCEKYKRLNF